MGGPPMPPKKSGPNIGLIVGLGCGGLFVVGVIVTIVAVFAVRKKASSISYTTTTPTTTSTGSLGSSSTGGSKTTTGTGNLKAELRDLRDFKGQFGKTRYFVGELYNTGEDPLGFPSAKVTLYDASNTAVDSGTCTSLVRVLPPGEKVPCFFSVFKGANYSTFKTEIKPMRSYYNGKIADLKISDVKFTPKRGYSPHQLDGKITNKSDFKAKSVWALVSLYGDDGKIVGADQALVAGNDLDPGMSGMFSAKVYNVAATPKKYEVIAVGYSD